MEATNIILILLSLVMPTLVAGLGMLSFVIKSNYSIRDMGWNNNISEETSGNSIRPIQVLSSDVMV